MKIELIPKWLDINEELLCVRILITSIHDKFALIKSTQFQYLEHEKPIKNTISEFIPFTYGRYKEMYLNAKGHRLEGAPEWREPVKVLESTDKLEPQETICVERLIKCDSKSQVQLGLQVKSDEIVDSWTTTCFAPLPKP